MTAACGICAMARSGRVLRKREAGSEAALLFPREVRGRATSCKATRSADAVGGGG